MYWELSDTERFTALWFCRCAEEEFEVETERPVVDMPTLRHV